MLAYGNSWASTADAAEQGSCRQYYPPLDASCYQRFVAATVRHFPRVPFWELWNEPNVPFFWRPSPDPAAYVNLLRAGFIGAKYENPFCAVLPGGLSGNGVSGNTTSGVPENYFAGIYESGGAGYFDIGNIHPYVAPGAGMAGLMRFVQQARAVMDGNGDAGKQLWLTEIGWPKEQCDAGLLADWVQTVYSLNQGGIFWYNLEDNPLPGFDERNYGLLNARHEPAPAYYAYRRAALLRQCRPVAPTPGKPQIIPY